MSCNGKKKILLAALTLLMVFSAGIFSDIQAMDNPGFGAKIELAPQLNLPNPEAKIYGYAGDEVSIRRILRDIGSIGNLNIILDNSVTGNVSIAFDDVTVKEALDYLRNLAGLYYMNKGDNILLVTTSDAASQKGINRTITKMIPVKYVNAAFIKSLLDNTVFASAAATAGSSSSGSSGSAQSKVTAEYRTNSLIVVGNENDIRLAEDIVSRIDFPRETKSYKINHASVIEVAQLLQATIFNDGVNPFGGGAVSAQAGGLPSAPTDVSVDIETYEEGSGASNEVQGAAGGAGVGAQQQTFTLRKKSISTKELKISPEGPVIVPDTRTNTLTIMGTAEQIALAESIIPTLDQKLPQVAIETSLVEVYEKGLRELAARIGSSSGQFANGFNNTRAVATPSAGNSAIGYNDPSGEPVQQRIINGQPVNVYTTNGLPYNVVGLPTNNTTKNQEGSSFAWTTMPIERSKQFLYQIDAVIASRKAKLLANPTVIAMHNTEAIISITEEVVKSTQVTAQASGFLATQVEIGEAGIILNILPKISGDGYVMLRIRPSVSTVAGQISDSQGNRISLLNRRDLAVQEVRVANGSTLALGGLIREDDTSGSSRLPIIGDLPLIGALFRTNSRENDRNELIMLVTPRIMEDEQPVASSSLSNLMNKEEFRQDLNK